MPSTQRPRNVRAVKGRLVTDPSAISLPPMARGKPESVNTMRPQVETSEPKLEDLSEDEEVDDVTMGRLKMNGE